jgi:hypothetical protein
MDEAIFTFINVNEGGLDIMKNIFDFSAVNIAG